MSLTLCSVQKKTKELIARKNPDSMTDRTYSENLSGHGRRSNKRISQLRDISIDNKNNI